MVCVGRDVNGSEMWEGERYRANKLFLQSVCQPHRRTLYSAMTHLSVNPGAQWTAVLEAVRGQRSVSTLRSEQANMRLKIQLF